MDYECDSTLAELKKRFPAEALVELVKMEDGDSPPMGAKGEVLYVDALGRCMCCGRPARHWESSLQSMRYAWFQKHREAAMDETIKAQLEQVRTTALTNMFDVAAVIRIAEHLGLDELAAYLAAGNAGEYTRFILTGKT